MSIAQYHFIESVLYFKLRNLSKKKLDELWERLTKNTKELQNGTDTRHGKPMYQRMLDDGTRINYRVDSKTGGSTIDINSRNPKTNIRIHIDK